MFRKIDFDFIYKKKSNKLIYNLVFYSVLLTIFISITRAKYDLLSILGSVLFCILAATSQCIKKPIIKIFLAYSSIFIIFCTLYLSGLSLSDLDFTIIFIPMAFMWVFPGSFHVAIMTIISIPFFIVLNRNSTGELASHLFRLIGVNFSAVIISALFRKIRVLLEFYKESLYLDELTNLPNRAALKDSIDKKINDVASQNKTLIFYQLDILKFQMINDSIGHKNGDEFLVKFSNRLKEFTDKNGFHLFKIGGDEFMIIEECPDSCEKSSSSIAEGLIFLSNEPIEIKGVELQVSVNLGIIFAPEFCKNKDDVLNFAKKALDTAKAKGENYYVIFNDSFKNIIERKRRIVEDLKYALALNQLDLYYQPKVSCTNGQIFGFEALIRWSHPRLGWISPLELIGIAEEEGLIIDLGKWVIKESLAKLHYLQKNGYKNIRISANLSPSQLNDINLVDFLKSEYSKYNFQNNQYELELTESAMMRNRDSCIKVLQTIRELGIKISVDDFGIEFSSLSYIKELPLDVLKIDRFFVKDIKGDFENHHVLNAIISLGKNLNLEIIAEGVETEEQLKYISNTSCLGYQGFYFSKAIPFGEAYSLLKQAN